jgi:hypothetical protein
MQFKFIINQMIIKNIREIIFAARSSYDSQYMREICIQTSSAIDTAFSF